MIDSYYQLNLTDPHYYSVSLEVVKDAMKDEV
jgi:hypothetical protein